MRWKRTPERQGGRFSPSFVSIEFGTPGCRKSKVVIWAASKYYWVLWGKMKSIMLNEWTQNRSIMSSDNTLDLINSENGYSLYPTCLMLAQDTFSPRRHGTLWPQSPIFHLLLPKTWNRCIRSPGFRYPSHTWQPRWMGSFQWHSDGR